MQNMMSGGMSGGYGMDPDQLDLMQLQKKKELAQQMVMGAKPAATRAGGILGVITALLAGRQMSQADEGIKSAMDRQNRRRMGDMDNFANLLTMRPQGPQAQTNPVANDDEGNPMPAAPMTMGESPDDFQARKLALAKSMIGSQNPQVAQFAMQSLMPQKKDFMTVKEGDTILDPTQIGPDGKPKLIWGGQHKAPEGFRYNAAGELEVIPGYAKGKGEIAAADKLPKMGDLRTRISGGQEVQDEWNGKAWVSVGSGPRWQPPQPGQPQLVPDGQGGMAWVSPPARGGNQPATLPTGGKIPDMNVRKGETDLRKEFEGLPEVKSYKMAFPAFAAVKDAATRNTPQADINLVYGIAKIFDPTSVVREGEYATVANSPNIPDRIKGVIQYVQGGGKLSPETKAKFVAEAESRVKSYEAEVSKAKESYGGMVKQYGYNPENVFQGMGNMGKKQPVSDAEINFTAKKYGITPAQVRARLGIPNE